MIKVLHIVEAFTGGIVTYLQALINGMSDEFQSYIFYAAIRPETPQMPEMLFKPGTELIKSEFLVRNLNLKKDIGAFCEIKKVYQQVQPDIVHLHSSKAGAIGRWALNGQNIPVFYTPNGYSFLMDQCGSIKKKMYYAIERICGYRSCITIACGKGEFEYSRKVSRRSIYINNSIDTDELDRLAFDVDSEHEPISVCTLARISQQKNPKLFNQIAEHFPQIRFVWIGDGEMREYLKSPNIEVKGWMQKTDALKELMRHSVFLLPSLWEGLPLSVLEAMYLKRLCIVSRIPGNTDIIENGENGYTCDNLDDYVNVINTLVSQGIDNRILEAARKRINQDFSQMNMVKKYEIVYKNALKAMK